MKKIYQILKCTTFSFWIQPLTGLYCTFPIVQNPLYYILYLQINFDYSKILLVRTDIEHIQSELFQSIQIDRILLYFENVFFKG